MSHRTQITLTDAQYARLLREADRTGLGLAELVRRALAAVYGGVEPEDALTALESSFGAWQGRDLDGETYVETIRPGLARRLPQ